ncbi:CAP domain-containing protein [Nocardioides sp. AN3]
MSAPTRTSVPTRTIVASVIAPLVLMLSAIVTSAPAQAGAPQTYSVAAVKATNAARHGHGLRGLRVDACLQRYANAQAARQAARRTMFHQDLGVMLRRCGLREAGENVAYGYRTGRAVVRQGWMKSPPHRANILHRSYRLVAVAARKGSDGLWYSSQVFGRR